MVATPPFLPETRMRPVPPPGAFPIVPGAKTITLSRFQLPPRPAGASHSTVGGPPPISTFLSFPAAKNPTNRLSGDQNGKVPPSVPGISRAPTAPTGRSQSWYLVGLPATKTMLRPSGDTATWVAMPVPPAGGPPNDVLSGGTIVNCTGPAEVGTSPARRRANAARTLSVNPIVSTPTDAHGGTRRQTDGECTMGVTPASS